MNLLLDIRNAFLPETIMSILVIVGIILTFLLRNGKQNIIYHISTYGSLLALLSFAYMPFLQEQNAFWHSFTSNSFTITFRILILIGTIITLQLTKKYVEGFGNSIGEFYSLILTAALGGMLLAGANDLIMVFVAFETLSISSFALCGYTRLDKLSNEAALKYLVIGSASTAIALYGFSFVYGLTGQTNFFGITGHLPQNNLLLLLGFLFILGGLGYKLAAVPFHSWAPDVYQGSPIPVAAFLSVVSKLAGFAVIIRLLSIFWNSVPIWNLSIAVIAVLTMTVGNLVAINQTNIKRLMAYSSIAQAGYVLVGLAIGTQAGIAGMIFYLIAYLFTNMGVWAAIEIYINQTGKDSIDAFDGIGFTQPTLALCMTIGLLSLAGIPVTAGFFGKFYLFQTVFFAGPGYLWLLIIALVNTVIAVYYYLRIIKAMFVKPVTVEIKEPVIPESRSLNLILGFTVTAVVLIGILSSYFISISETAATTINLGQVTAVNK